MSNSNSNSNSSTNTNVKSNKNDTEKIKLIKKELQQQDDYAGAIGVISDAIEENAIAAKQELAEQNELVVDIAEDMDHTNKSIEIISKKLDNVTKRKCTTCSVVGCSIVVVIICIIVMYFLFK